MSGVSGWELARERGERIAVLEREREQLAAERDRLTVGLGLTESEREVWQARAEEAEREAHELRAALVLLRAERDELAAEIAAALLSEVHP